MKEQEVEHGTGGELLSVEPFSKVVGLSVSALNKMRGAGNGPPYYKVGKYVRYDVDEGRAWMRSRRFRSTSEESAA